MTGPIRLIFDECLGPPLLEPIRQLESFGNVAVEIDHVLSFQKEGVRDQEWIPLRAAEGWIAVTADRGSRGNSKEKGRKFTRVCFECGMRHVILSATLHDQPAIRKAEAIVAVFRDLLLTAEYPPGSRFSIQQRANGSVVLLHVPLDDSGNPLQGAELKQARRNPIGTLRVH